MMRKRLSKKKSKRMFTKTFKINARRRTASNNKRKTMMRGGYRL